MCSDEKDNDLRASLDKGARANLLAVPKDKLENLTQKIEALRQIQRQRDELEAKFLKERARHEAECEKLYQPLFTKRFDIVNGLDGVQGAANGAMDLGEDKASKEKGVPNFWLTAMTNNSLLAQEITKADEEALKYLIDIKSSRIVCCREFKLEFFFGPNPYFKNYVLAKKFVMIDEVKLIFDEAIGTKIKWYPEKCLTRECSTRKPKKSFFNFFKSLEFPVYDESIDVKLLHQLEHDYEIGVTIKKEIVCHAISWFSGDATCGRRTKRKIEFDNPAAENLAQKNESLRKIERYDIVNGVTEVKGAPNDGAMVQSEDKATKEKGVPDFWFIAMKSHHGLRQNIAKHDQGALKYLTDIKWSRINDSEGFKLEFTFGPNPYFKNSVLEKTYRMIDETDIVLEEAIGTVIHWYPGQCWIEKAERSFFNFFEPLEVPTDVEENTQVMENKASISSLLLLLLIISGGQSEVILNIENQCSYTVWLAASPSSGDFNSEHAPGTLEIFSMPEPWTGSIWARTKCSNNESFYFSCETGDCGTGQVDCQGPMPRYPVTLLNLSINNKSEVSYEVNLNHGFNVPIRIRPDGGTLVDRSGSSCPVVDCIADLSNVCAPELVATNKNGSYVACNSPCDALRDARFCCTENFSGQACQPNQYSKKFKQLCGLAHTYPADNNPPTYSCGGANRYNVTFCPL